MRYYVTADVHGFFSELKASLDEAGFFEDKEPHKLIICGDIYDRGSEALQLQAFLLDLLERDEVILIRGNHEDLMEDMLAIHYPRTHDISNGTYYSAVDLTGKNNVDDIFIAMRNNKDYNDYMSSTVDYFETETAIFVHGWIPCFYWESWSGVRHEWSKNENWREVQDWTPYRWLNGMEAWKNGVREKDKTIFCGHWHTSFGNYRYHQSGDCEFGKTADFEPFVDTGIVALDSCVAFSKKINVYVLEEN